MNKLCWFFLIFLCQAVLAQEQAVILDTKVDGNDIEGENILVRLDLKIKAGYRIHPNFIYVNDNVPCFLTGTSTRDTISKGIYVSGMSFVGFRFDADDKLKGWLKKKENGYVRIGDTLFLKLVRDDEPYTIDSYITPQQVKDSTIGKISVASEIFRSLTVRENRFDAGFIPKGESSSDATEYYVNFNFTKKYPFIKNSPVYFEASGLVSTNRNDSLNHLRFYPLSFNLLDRKSQVDLQAGIEGNQTFSFYRFTGNLSWQGLLPNPVDLTFGCNRLRLKPVVQAGIRVFSESDRREKTPVHKSITASMAYGQLYYYIPAYEIYSILLEGNVFYIFNNEINPDKELKYLYSVTLGMEIKGSGIKTILKYVNGENDIGYDKKSAVMIGLMADLFDRNK